MVAARDGFARLTPRPLPTATVAVAVSAGVDSMVLLGLCQALVNDGQLGGLVALHINHSLRPAAETELDYQLVRDYCAVQRIPLDYSVIPRGEISAASRVGSAGGEGSERFDPQQPANPHRDGGLEGAGRYARLRSFATLLARRNLKHLCTAHHRDDNAETVLMRLLVGGGVNGLSAISSLQQMRTITDDGTQYHYSILRPLLAVRKETLIQWATDASIPYREDSSNLDLAILRNSLRATLTPAVSALFPRYHRALERVSEQVELWRAYIDAEHTRLLRWQPQAGDGADSGSGADSGGRDSGSGGELPVCFRIEARRFFDAHRALQVQSFYAVSNRLGARRRLPYRFVLQCLSAFASDYRGERGSGHGVRCYSDAEYLYLARYRPLARLKEDAV